MLVGEHIHHQQSATKQTSAWHYKPINACIGLLAQIQNKSIITVEALANGDNLHPAQQAMIDKHGSQCGFCTPGIVMSLAALFENTPPDKTFLLSEIYDALSGNLCRCTGYKPIIDAAASMKGYSGSIQPEMWSPSDTADTANDTLTPAPELKLSLESEPEPEPEYVTHQADDGIAWSLSSEEQLKLLLAKHPTARIVAGATDLSLEVTQQNKRIQKLIAINQIESLKAIYVDKESITIGAAVTLTDAEEILAEHFPEFSRLLERFAARQVRNMGTIGGNIANASPIGDTPPVLIALGADIEIASVNGCTWLALDRFFVDYKQTRLKADEYIRAIRIPRLAPNDHLKVYKISKRFEDDISAVLLALRLRVSDGVICRVRSGFGGMAAIPKAGPMVEAALIDQPMTLATFKNAGTKVEQDFQPFSDVRASSAYRIQVTRGLLEKAALEILNPEKLSRIESISTSSLDSQQVIERTMHKHAGSNNA